MAATRMLHQQIPRGQEARGRSREAEKLAEAATRKSEASRLADLEEKDLEKEEQAALEKNSDEVKKKQSRTVEETLPSGEKLTDAINRNNENVKYLPGNKLGKNVVADPDLENAVNGANMLVFVTPHQFMDGICGRLVGKVKADVEAISLIKGMEVKMEGPCMISTLISQQLGINCCVLMGANIANEIAVEKFSEATVGYRENKEIAQNWVQLFSTSYFIVTPQVLWMGWRWEITQRLQL